MTARGYTVPPAFMPNAVDHRRKLAEGIASAMAGKLNATSQVTLTPSAATTTVTDARIGSTTHISLSPLTADAAAAVTTTYVSAQINGQATLTHTSAASADRTFSMLMIG